MFYAGWHMQKWASPSDQQHISEHIIYLTTYFKMLSVFFPFSPLSFPNPLLSYLPLLRKHMLTRNVSINFELRVKIC